LLQPVNARSQGCHLRPQRFQFILWIGHAGKLSYLPSQRKGFVVWQLNIKERRRFTGFVFDTGVRIHPDLSSCPFIGSFDKADCLFRMMSQNGMSR
jgi:hypothetical protein